MNLNPESNNINPNSFFITGGAIGVEAPSYITRLADELLFQYLMDGEYCTIFAPPQMGKTSLMIRTVHRLQENDIRTTIIDITQMGTKVTIDQWYLSILIQIQSALGLTTEAEEWWEQYKTLTANQRFANFIHNVVLAEVRQSIVVFIDEIDYVLRSSFSDDFFAAIKAMYNSRSQDPDLERLSFVFIGVATPNIGKQITLKEFSQQDAHILQEGLKHFIGERGTLVFQRIFHWTNGHPYLTQKLCLTVADRQTNTWNDKAVDKLVEQLFLSDKFILDPNLKYLHQYIENSKYKNKMVDVYAQIWHGGKVPAMEQSEVQNRLRVIGLIRVNENAHPKTLAVRNLIYKRSFNRDWIKSMIPAAEKPSIWKQPYLYLVLLLFLFILFAGFIVALDSDDGELIEFLAQNGSTAANSASEPSLTPTADPEIIVQTATPLPSNTVGVIAKVPATTATPSPTNTLVPTNTPLPTDTPTPEPSPTITPTPSETPVPSPTVIPMAGVKENEIARVYFGPVTTSKELALLRAGDQVEVLGRSAGRFGRERDEPGLYVRTSKGVEGFVVARFFDWPGVIYNLDIIQPKAIALFNSNIRVEPNETSERITAVLQGEYIEIVGISTDGQWYFIRTSDGTEGFAEAARINWPGGVKETLQVKE